MSLEHAERLGLPLRGAEQVVGQLDKAIHTVHLLGDSIMGHPTTDTLSQYFQCVKDILLYQNEVTPWLNHLPAWHPGLPRTWLWQGRRTQAGRGRP